MNDGSNVSTMPLFTAAFREWLSETPGGEEKLIGRGMQPGNLRSLRDGTASENIILMHRNVLKEIAKLDLREFVLEQAKADLWGDHDHLPHLSTYALLLDALRVEYKKQGGAMTDRIGVCRTHISRWFDGTRSISLTPMQNVLRLLAGEKTLVKKAPRPARTEKQEQMPDQKDRIQKVIGSCISMLNSLLNVLNNLLTDPAAVLDGDRAQAIRCINRMLVLFDIDQAALKRLMEAEPITEKDTDLLRIITALNQTQKKRRRS